MNANSDDGFVVSFGGLGADERGAGLEKAVPRPASRSTAFPFGGVGETKVVKGAPVSTPSTFRTPVTASPSGESTPAGSSASCACERALFFQVCGLNRDRRFVVVDVDSCAAPGAADTAADDIVYVDPTDTRPMNAARCKCWTADS